MDKFDMIKLLDTLPDEIAEQAYSLDPIIKRVLLQHNLYLEDKYKKDRVNGNDVYTEYKINGWRVLFELED